MSYLVNHKECSASKITPSPSPFRGALASWLERSTPDRVVRVRALAGDIVLRPWTRHFTLTVPLFTQEN